MIQEKEILITSISYTQIREDDMRSSYRTRRNTEVKAKLEDEEVEKTYSFKEVLGRGAFGVVNRAVKDGNEFAVKTLKCVRLQQRKDAEREIAILQLLDDDHICRLKMACRSGRNIFMVMELCTGGELFDKITHDTDIIEPSVVAYMRQICQALKYLHSKNIIHLDLKPENVVIANQSNDVVKIIDFGGAQFYTKGKVVRTMFGTREYMAPETLGYDPVEFTTDMWSAGVLCYNLLSGLSPFLGDDDSETECSIQTCEWDYDCIEFDHVSEEAKDFISNLLVRDPAERMTSDECLHHPWLNASTRADIKDARSLSITLIGNLKALIARRRWNRAGTAMQALTRLSSFKTEKTICQIDEKPTPAPKVEPVQVNRYCEPKNTPKIALRNLEDLTVPAVTTTVKNENNNNNLLSHEILNLDISAIMKFKPPVETVIPEVTFETVIPEASLETVINPNHQKRTISQESTDSGESGISTDNSNSHNDLDIKNLDIKKCPIVNHSVPRYQRKDSGLSSDGEEEDIIIIRRSRKRIPLVVKD